MEDTLLSIMPYVVSVICALISGLASYGVTRKQTKAEVAKLEKQHQLDIEKEKERFALEKEKMEIEYQNQLELQQKNFENQLSGNLVSTIFSEAMKMPEVRNQFSKGINSAKKKK